MAHLILVNPAGGKKLYQGLGDDLMAIEPPLWCRLIAGYCRDKGHKVEIIDAEALGLEPRDVGRLIADRQPDLVGMIVYGHQPNASTQQMEPAGLTCGAIKAFCDVPIIIAGGHVTVLPEKTMMEEFVNYVAMGEGAITIENLLSEVNIHFIPGLVWYDIDEDKIYRNPPPPPMDVNQLYGRTWDLLPMDKYRAHNWHCDDGRPRQPYASIYTSLGCPFKCSFCCINAPFGGPGYRVRAPLEVVDEVQFLYNKYGITNFKIIDEMFVLKPTHYLPICEGLAELPFADKLNFWAYARVDTVKEEHLPLLRKAGIRWLALGIESGSSHVRDGANKTLSSMEIDDIVETIQKHDIKVIGNFIFGLPDDTFETMNETLEVAMGLGCDFVNFYAAMAYPGSKLFETVDPKNLPDTWAGYAQHSYECKPLPTEHLTSEEVLAFRDYAHCEYFHNDPILGKPLRRKILEPTDLHEE